MDYKEIEAICEKHEIENWCLVDGLVNVEGTVLLGDGLTKLPLAFGKVTGHFACASNLITTLKGSPYYVGGHFCINNNNLTSLNYLPETITGILDFSYNKIYDVNNIECIFTCDNNPVKHIYKYINPEYFITNLGIDIDYFNDCKILINKVFYVERFKTFLDSYGLGSDVNIDEFIEAGYIIK